MSPDQTALVLFHREVLLPEIRRAVAEAVAPLSDRLSVIEKRLKKVDQRIDASNSFAYRVGEQVEMVDAKLEGIDTLWAMTKAIADTVGAKVPWKKLAETSEEGVG